MKIDPPFLKRGLIRQVRAHDDEGAVDVDPNSPKTGQGYPGDRKAYGALQEHGSQIPAGWPDRVAARLAREMGKQTRSVIAGRIKAAKPDRLPANVLLQVSTRMEY